MKGTVVVALAVAFLALCTHAEGAQPVYGPIWGGAYDELLPVLVRGRTFVPSFKVRIEYDDNVFTDEVDELEDWKLAIEPKFDIHILRELAYYGFSYQYSLSIFQDRDPDTDQSHDLSLTINRKITERIELRVRDRYRKMQEPELVELTVTEGIADERVFTRRLRNDRDYNVFSPTVLVDIAPKVNASASYNHVMIDYEDEEVSLLGDYVAQTATASGNYILSPQTYLTGTYRYQDTDYDDDTTKVDSVSNFVSIGASHQFSPTVTANVQVGVEKREFADYTRTTDEDEEETVTDQTQTAPYVTANLRAPVSETVATELGYTYRIEETTQASFLSQELQSVYLGISQSFTDRFSAVFNATYDFGDFKIDQARFSDITRDFEETSLQFALVFRFEITPNWNAELGWRFSDVDSDFPGESYRRNRTFLGVSAIF